MIVKKWKHWYHFHLLSCLLLYICCVDELCVWLELNHLCSVWNHFQQCWKLVIRSFLTSILSNVFVDFVGCWCLAAGPWLCRNLLTGYCNSRYRRRNRYGHCSWICRGNRDRIPWWLLGYWFDRFGINLIQVLHGCSRLYYIWSMALQQVCYRYVVALALVLNSTFENLDVRNSWEILMNGFGIAGCCYADTNWRLTSTFTSPFLFCFDR